MSTKLRLGTRGSRLALAQAHAVQHQLLQLRPDADVDIVIIKTSGDLGHRERLGAFVGEIQDSLLRKEIDVALHCLKDLPTEPVEGLRFSAYLERENAADTLISRGPSLAELPAGAVVGTGSVRRTSQLAAQRPDLVFRALVGNVDTRMRKLMDGEYDAIVLAIAGLKRLGVLDGWATSDYASLTVREMPYDEMLPCPGQAVLVLETNRANAEAHDWVSSLNHVHTGLCSEAERAFLRAFGGGCSVPVASFARVDGGVLTLSGLVASPDGKTVLRDTVSGAPEQGLDLARSMAAKLGEQGAFNLFEARVPEPRGGVL